MAKSPAGTGSGSRPSVGRRSAANEDETVVAELLGRSPRADFEVVLRDADGVPRVICNAPFLHDGTPMPTRYWLVDAELVRSVSGLEAQGGCSEAETAVNAQELAACHQRHATERDRHITITHAGPRPSGGVGGTARGVKCLHAHLANHLAGGDDPVGRWVEQQLSERGR